MAQDVPKHTIERPTWSGHVLAPLRIGRTGAGGGRPKTEPQGAAALVRIDLRSQADLRGSKKQAARI